MVSRPSSSMASRPFTARLITAVSNCAISAIAKQLTSVDVDLDPDPAAHQRTNKPRHAFDLGADIEDLRFQRLPAGKRQQLRGQLRCPFHRFRDRIDVTAAAVFRQIAATKEVGRGPDDGQEIVEVVRHAAGELTHGLHLLRLAQRFLALAAFGDIDGLGNGADHCRHAGCAADASRNRNNARRRADGAASRSGLPLRSMTAMKASRTASRMPSVLMNQGVSQNGLPMTSAASA